MPTSGHRQPFCGRVRQAVCMQRPCGCAHVHGMKVLGLFDVDRPHHGASAAPSGMLGRARWSWLPRGAEAMDGAQRPKQS